jgi:N-acyl-D-aspartate/D-glutamate deacylase
MTLDLKITGGTVIDGTGTPGRLADVGVRDGRIVAVAEPGAVEESASATIAAGGLVVAPGFVDLHTHYDAQLLWDPTASPSPLHGVTTVFGGNCGFTLAPAGEEHADFLARMMSRVEGIPLEALRAGVPWNWRTFGEYLERVEQARPAVNCGFLVGHSALRRVVLGDACGGEASPEQVDAMVALLRDALAAGAMGFSSSRAPTHNDGDGNPVPSRSAGDDELVALAATIGERPGTQLELIVAGCLGAFSDEEIALLGQLSAAAQRPLNWNVLNVMASGNHAHQLSASDGAAAVGGRVAALTMPITTQIRLSFLSGFVLDGLPGWREVLGRPVPERLRLLTDPDVRRTLDERAHSEEAGMLAGLARWERLVVAEAFDDETKQWQGMHVGDIAEAQGKAPFDALLDIVVADGLRTGLRPDLPTESRETWEARRDVWLDPRSIVGASDAGAHLDLFCTVPYSTFLVGPAVREHDLLSLEEAVHQLTDVPARYYGVRDRGRVAEGWWGDLVVFDPGTVGPAGERTVDDLPGGASRLTADARGIEHVVVAGTPIVQSGSFTGAQPGRVLRSAIDTDTVSVS